MIFIGPPDAVKNVSVENITSFSVDISWDSPDPGSAKLGTYLITCENCPKDRREFPIKTSKNQITANNLGAYAYYKIKIVNVNNITTITGKNVSTTTNFTTSEGGISDSFFYRFYSPKQPPDVFCTKSVLKNVAKFTGKHLCQSLFLIKLQAWPTTLLKKRLWNRCFPVNFATFLRTSLLGKHLFWLTASNFTLLNHFMLLVCYYTP